MKSEYKKTIVAVISFLWVLMMILSTVCYYFDLLIPGVSLIEVLFWNTIIVALVCGSVIILPILMPPPTLRMK